MALSGREADVQTALMNVCFEGNNGHAADVTRCVLMTQSRHPPRARHVGSHAASNFAEQIRGVKIRAALDEVPVSGDA
jgi:hypothetical protein